MSTIGEISGDGLAESTDWNERTFVMKGTDSDSEVELPTNFKIFQTPI